MLTKYAYAVGLKVICCKH